MHTPQLFVLIDTLRQCSIENDLSAALIYCESVLTEDKLSKAAEREKRKRAAELKQQKSGAPRAKNKRQRPN